MGNAARLTVLGSLNMDISVTVPALPGPGATVLGGKAVFAPGGKGANQAVAAARLGRAASAGARAAVGGKAGDGANDAGGVTVAMVGCVGDDDFGRALRAALRAEGIDDRGVRAVAQVPTGVALITVDQAGENTITVAPGANHEVGQAELARAAADGERDVLVLSAEIPLAAVRAALAARAGAAAAGVITVLNLAPAPPRAQAAALLSARPHWLIVNESEAAAVLGRPVAGLPAAALAAAELVAAGARNAVVTAGAAGTAYQAGQEAAGTVAAFPVRAVDTVGAGDTFVGALAVVLAAGLAPDEAVTAASAAAATAVTRPGTQAGMPHPGDVLAATGYRWPLSAAR